MSNSHPHLHDWLDRPLDDEQVASLSAHLALDPALADEMAERVWLDQALKSILPVVMPRRSAARQPVRKILFAAAACVLIGVIVWRSSKPTTALPPEPSSAISIFESQPPRGALPRPPRSQDERSRAALGRLLRQQSTGHRSFAGTTLREIADECLGRLQQRAGFVGVFDLRQAGSRTELPLTFTKPAGSLRGLLLHAAALAGCDVILGPNSVSFVPLTGSEITAMTKRFSADPHLSHATREFWSTGVLPPSWGLPHADFQVTVHAGNYVTATATEWHLAQLERVLMALDAPTLEVDFSVFTLPPVEVLEGIGMPLQTPAVAPDGQGPPAAMLGTERFPMIIGGAVLTEAQWERARPTFVSSPQSTLVDINISVVSERQTDLGEQAPDVLRWNHETLGLRVSLSPDGFVFDLNLGGMEIGANPASAPPSGTALSVWPDMTVLLPYLDPVAPPETRRRVIAIRVHPLD